MSLNHVSHLQDKCVSVFVFQQLLSLQEKLTSKEAELEQAKEEHRYLEGEVLTLRDKVRTPGRIPVVLRMTL